LRVWNVTTTTTGIVVHDDAVIVGIIHHIEMMPPPLPSISTIAMMRTTRPAIVRDAVWIEWQRLGQEPQYSRNITSNERP
jgi:hypothetical protein